MDKMTWQSKDYELARSDMKLARMIEETEKSEDVIEAYTNELEVVLYAIGEKATEEILGSTDIEEIDLVTLVLVYNSVIDGYEKRIVEMKDKKDQRIFNSAGFKGISKVADDVRVIQSVDAK